MKEIIRTFYSPDKNDIPPFYLEMAGISYCDGSYWMQRKCSTETVFEYVTAGRGNLIVNGESYEASAGNIWLLRQKTEHYYRSSADDPWIKIFFNIRGPLAEQIINEYPIKDKVIFDGVGFEDEFHEMLQNLKDEYTPQTELFNQTAIWFLRMVIRLSDNLNSQKNSSEINRLKEYISLHLDRIDSNDELAKVIFRSKDYCIKNFRKAFGVTPYEYQISKKITTAKNLLRNTYLSIGEIALRLGYDDQHYFSHLFKKRYGVSPSEYRQFHH